MRRIVTGNKPTGESFIVSDGQPPRVDRFTSIPGFVSSLVWSTDQAEKGSGANVDVTAVVTSFVPSPGGSRLIEMVFPPDSVRRVPDFDFFAFGAEFLRSMPGLAELFSPDGMHVTPTIDYAIVTAGEMTLETDNGVLTPVRAGDIVVQNGTRHAWRNLSKSSATIVIALLGV